MFHRTRAKQRVIAFHPRRGGTSKGSSQRQDKIHKKHLLPAILIVYFIQMDASNPPLIIEDGEFTKAALDILGEDEIFKLKCFLAEQPQKGDLIPRSGGLRKLRWAAKGKGKRGGARVIYYYIIEPKTIRLMDIYTKNEQENISVKALEELKKRSHE